MANKADSGLPAVTTLVTSDLLAPTVGGVTSKITAGNFRTALFAFAASDPINTGSLTAVGNSTITGTLSGLTTLTATTGVFTNLTVPTPAQPNITSFGTLVSDLLFVDASYDIGKTGATRPRDLFMSRNLTVGGTSRVTSTAQFDGLITNANGFTTPMTWSGGTTGHQYFQATSSGANLVWGIERSIGGAFMGGSSAYAAVFGTLTATSVQLGTNGVVGLTLNSAGSLVFAQSVSKLVPGATSFSHRNNADTLDNLLIVDAGTATFRSAVVVGTNINFTAAAAKILRGATSLSIRDNADTADLMLFNSSGITLTNSLITTASVTGGAGLNVPHGTAPTSPVNGDLWSTTTTLNFRLNGVTKSITMT